MELRDRLQDALGTAYRIERELTGGGMSRVFVAHEQALGRTVVVKVLPPAVAGSVNADRFEREIRLMAQLQHPCIVPLLTVGDFDGLPFYTMPYVAGESLRARLVREGSLPQTEVTGILRDVASALAYAHAQGVVHRDIKPDNVLESGGYAVVTDFGIAKALASARIDAGQAGTLTTVGVTVGTAAYMAPEQALGDPTADHRVDLYALGMTAYELLTGATPFAGRTLHAMVAAHVAEAPPSIAERVPELSRRLASLIMRCIAKSPDDRPATAQEVVAELDEIERRDSVRGERAVSESSNDSSLGDAKPRVTRRAVAGAAVVIGALVLSVIATRFVRSHRTVEALGVVHSTAVLPLAAPAGDTALAEMGDQIADELSQTLRRQPGLTVSSRLSASAFRNSAASPRDVAARLHADALVAGLLARDGQYVRVTLNVLRGRDAATVATIDASTDAAHDLIDVQRQLADSLARLVAGGEAVLHGPGTRNAAAYDLYLRARSLEYHRGGGLRRAAALFDSATKIDSTFAEAWAGLAESLSLLPLYENAPADSVQMPASAAAQRALRLDSRLAEAHTAIGNVRTTQWDWEGAITAFEEARRLDPSNANALQYLAEVLFLEGRVHEAIPIVQRAIELDPLSPVQAAVMSTMSLFDGEIDTAYAHARRAYDLDPTFAGSLRSYARVLYAKDSVDKALELLARSPAGVTGIGVLGFYDAIAGRRAAALDALRQLEQEDARHSVAALNVALVYVGLGDTAQALRWIEKLPARHEMMRQSTSVADPAFARLWPSPRFAAVLRQFGLDASQYHPPATSLGRGFPR